MNNAIEGVLLSREEARRMERIEDLDLAIERAQAQYEAFMKSLQVEAVEQDDPSNLTYKDVPGWFVALNYAVPLGLVAWGVKVIFF